MIKLSETLKKLGYGVEIYKNSKEAKEALLDKITSGESVGFGGSTTIQDMGIFEELEARGNELHWHWKAEDKPAALAKATSTDAYIASTNALTEDGKLVNKDGVGNRVASMIYGHKNVYLVVGKNKICKDYKAAIERIENIAAPKNAVRLGLDTPCAHTGKCNDCDSADRICRVESVIHRNPSGTKINILLVDEELGY